jgi:hypothetical protein
MEDEMRRNRLDDRTADRLLAGALPVDDAPPGYEAVVALVAAAGQPASTQELATEAAVVAAVVDAVHSNPTAPTTNPTRKSMLTKVLTLKAAALAGVLFIGAGAAAAATNTLPDQAQNAVSGAAKHVGLKVAKANSHASNDHSGDHTPGNGKAKGPDASGQAAKGLCNAYAAHTSTSTSEPSNGKWADSVAFQNLAKAAADAGKSIPDYCATVTTTTTHDGTENEAPEAPETDVEHGGKPDNAGKSEDHATVSTPNSGGTGTASTASDGNNSKGADTANEHSNGASAGGSSNSEGHGQGGHPGS